MTLSFERQKRSEVDVPKAFDARFPDDNWAEVLEGGGFTFHRPCDVQEGQTGQEIDQIEAKPRGRKELRLKDALQTVQAYLNGKPEVELFEWPQKVCSRIGGDHPGTGTTPTSSNALRSWLTTRRMAVMDRNNLHYCYQARRPEQVQVKGTN